MICRGPRGSTCSPSSARRRPSSGAVVITSGSLVAPGESRRPAGARPAVPGVRVDADAAQRGAVRGVGQLLGRARRGGAHRPGGAALVGPDGGAAACGPGCRWSSGCSTARSSPSAATRPVASTSWLGGAVGVPKVNAFDDLIGPYAAATAVFVPLNILLTLTMIRLADQRQRHWRCRCAGWPSSCCPTWATARSGCWWPGSGRPCSRSRRCSCCCRCSSPAGRSASITRSSAPTTPRSPRCARRWRPRTTTPGATARASRSASSMIAQEIGMGLERLRAIRYAGMLHDVGKLGVPTKVLQKDGPLTEEEFAAIQLHPMRGLEIVRGIDFLDEAFAGIMHHHERHDGKGYPMGLAGRRDPGVRPDHRGGRRVRLDDLRPLLPRRPPVEVAVAELRKGAGTPVRPGDGRGVHPGARPRAAGSRRAASSRRRPTGAETATKDHDDPTMPIEVVTRAVTRVLPAGFGLDRAAAARSARPACSPWPGSRTPPPWGWTGPRSPSGSARSSRPASWPGSRCRATGRWRRSAPPPRSATRCCSTSAAPRCGTRRSRSSP